MIAFLFIASLLAPTQQKNKLLQLENVGRAALIFFIGSHLQGCCNVDKYDHEPTTLRNGCIRTFVDRSNPEKITDVLQSKQQFGQYDCDAEAFAPERWAVFCCPKSSSSSKKLQCIMKNHVWPSKGESSGEFFGNIDKLFESITVPVRKIDLAWGIGAVHAWACYSENETVKGETNTSNNSVDQSTTRKSSQDLSNGCTRDFIPFDKAQDVTQLLVKKEVNHTCDVMDFGPFSNQHGVFVYCCPQSSSSNSSDYNSCSVKMNHDDFVMQNMDENPEKKADDFVQKLETPIQNLDVGWFYSKVSMSKVYFWDIYEWECMPFKQSEDVITV